MFHSVAYVMAARIALIFSSIIYPGIIFSALDSRSLAFFSSERTKRSSLLFSASRCLIGVGIVIFRLRSNQPMIASSSNKRTALAAEGDVRHSIVRTVKHGCGPEFQTSPSVVERHSHRSLSQRSNISFPQLIRWWRSVYVSRCLRTIDAPSPRVAS